MRLDTRKPLTFDEHVVHSGLPRLEARALMEAATGRTRTWLIAHGDEAADSEEAERFIALASARRAGEPLAYLVGYREFNGLTFAVDRATLIPRPETEHLVEAGLAMLQGRAGPTVIDLGTGSGIVAICLALARPDASVWATDRSAGALTVARRNATTLAAKVEFREGDWWAAIANETLAFDLIVSNPPYIAAADPHLEQGDLRFEPLTALSPGARGTEAIEAILAGAIDHLRPGGWIAFEHGHDQGQAIRQLLAARGLEAVSTRQDLAGLDRITGGRRGSG